jgi:LPS export ABC transporter permease LptF/LPS export ABC transporter permease LptG
VIAQPRRTLLRYLQRQPIVPTAFAVLGFTLVVLMSDLLGLSELVINRGLGTAEVAGILLWDALPALSRTLPFAVMVGCLVALGRLGADRELLALEASGLPTLSLLRPMLRFAGAASLLALALSLLAAPWSSASLNASLAEFVRRNPGAAIQPGRINRFGDWKLEAREVSPQGDELRGVLVWAPSVGETVFARRARVGRAPGGARIELEDGLFVLDPDSGPRQVRFTSLESRIPLGDADHTGDPLASSSMAELVEAMRSELPIERRRGASAEWHRRLAFPTATLLFGVLALPISQLRRRSSRAGGVVLGLGVVVVYYGLAQLGNGLLRGDTVPVALAVWLPNLVLAAVGAALFGARARRPDARGSAARTRRGASAGGEATVPVRFHRHAIPRYVLSRFGRMTALCFGCLLVVFLLVDLLDNLQWFAKYAATLEEVARFYAARSAVLAARAVPLALLLGAALTVSLLSVEGELTGMRCCGISTGHAVLPILVLCGIAVPLDHLLGDQLVPRAHALASRVKHTEIKDRPDTERQRRTSVWYRSLDRLFEVESLDPGAGVARGVTFYELDEEGFPRSRTDAVAARHIGDGVWRLVDPIRVEVGNGTPSRAQPHPFAELGEEIPADRDTSHLTLADLRHELETARSSGYSVARYQVDFHAKLASPLACLLLPALALFFAATGPPFPRPSLIVFSSGIIAVGHLLLSGVGAALGYAGTLPAAVAGWGPTALLTGIAVWLWRRVGGSGQGF